MTNPRNSQPGGIACTRPAIYQPFRPGPHNAGLHGTGRVADDVYLLAHNDRSGRPRLRKRPLGIVVAAGLLAELILANTASVRGDGTVLLAGQFAWPTDELACAVLRQITAEPEPLPLRKWLLFLSRHSCQQVAGRLERAGYLRHVRSGLPGHHGRWKPVNPDWAHMPALRASRGLDPACGSVYNTVLAGLAFAADLDSRLDQRCEGSGGAAGQAAAFLPPGLRELIAHTKTTVDSLVLSDRA